MATNFQSPITQGGPDTGNSQNTTVGVPFFKKVTVSAGARDATFLLPEGAFIQSATGFVTVACSSLGQGGKIQIGSQAIDAKYASVGAVQASGAYVLTMTEACVSAVTTVVVKVTASVAASAAQFTEGKITVNIIGGFNGV